MRNFLFGALVLVVLVGGSLGAYVWRVSQGLDAASVEASHKESSDLFIDVKGVTVRVRDEGPKEAPVLLMLHGFTFSLESFDALAALMVPDFRVVRYDLRGHGLTGPDPEKRYSPDQRADHIGAVMAALGIENATLVGNSLGGLASWRFAAKEPSRIDHLVLISPGAYPINGVGDEPAPVPTALEAYLRMVPEAGLELSLDRIYADAGVLTDERRTEIRDMMRREGNGQAFIDALKVFTLPDPEPILSKLSVPTLIVWGAEDQVISPNHGKRMEAVIPDAKLVFFEATGHVAHEEKPARMASELKQFLANE